MFLIWAVVSRSLVSVCMSIVSSPVVGPSSVISSIAFPGMRTIIVTMSGELKNNSETDESDADLSDSVDDFKSGAISMILGHPESWMTSTALVIVDALTKQGLIVATFIDEFQMNLKDHWGSDFRLDLNVIITIICMSLFFPLGLK